VCLLFLITTHFEKQAFLSLNFATFAGMANFSPSSSIRDNQQRGKVSEFLKDHLVEDSELRVVSAYFTIYAYHALRRQLEHLNKIEFLFGEPRFLKKLDPEKNDRKSFKIEDEGISLRDRLEQGAVAKACAAWIREKVEIKSMIKPNFLHGKLYHVRKPGGKEKAITGSSNFTMSGLGLSKSSNVELNLLVTDERDREDLVAWFDQFWQESGCYSHLVEDVKEEVLKYLEQLYTENTPRFVYYKTLYHLFEDYLNQQRDEILIDPRTGFFDSTVWNTLYDFQRDGVRAAINKIKRHNGCIIADSVGLGKTYEALAVIKYFEDSNQRVLVLCPKKLRENWTIWRDNDERNNLAADSFSYDVLSHTDLNRKSGKVGDLNLDTIKWGNYGLVVIDESHNFRSAKGGKENEEGEYRMSRYEFLMKEVIKGGIKTKVLLLSATPVNNNLRDLRNQIYLITGDDDHAFKGIGVKSLTNTMRVAQYEFSKWATPEKNPITGEKPERRVSDLLDRLTTSNFFPLLDEVTIARSRNHVRKYYDMAAIGKFPTRLPVQSVYAEIDLRKRFKSYDELNDIISRFRLAIYNPSAYVKKEWQDHYREKSSSRVRGFIMADRESSLISMMRINFLKRLESSVYSFATTLERTLRKIEALQAKLKAFQDGQLENDELDGEDQIDQELMEDQDAQEAETVGKSLRYHLSHLDIDLWLSDLEEDRREFIKLEESAEAVKPQRDAKLHELRRVIQQKLDQPLNKNNPKVIVFTAFSDTARYLYQNMTGWAEQRGIQCGLVTGGSSDNRSTFQPEGFVKQQDFNAILTNFAPRAKKRDKMTRSMPQEGGIDLLIATDCISEGQNLQDGDMVINYDIHWNPVRLIQRFGRIDRLGSTNEVIKMVNFWPTKHLNKYINLKDRVEARMALVDITATGEDNLLNTEQVVDLVEDDLKYRDRQLLRMQEEVLDLEDTDENVSLSEFSLEDFRADLLQFLEADQQKLATAPLGLHALVPAPEKDTEYAKIIRPGVIYCLRQKGEAKELKTVNPLQPYFLIYIRNDGEVRFRYTAAKQILDIYRHLCAGEDQVHEQLCEMFDQKTANGEQMQDYAKLLQSALRSIQGTVERKSAAALKGRGGRLVPDTVKADNDGFELITWLIVESKD
jgi:SNF2 family DNA or RNA helicase